MTEYIIDYNLNKRCEEVVRCRDCKYGVDEGLWCKHFANYGDLPTVQPDGFCAWGDRRD